MKKIATLVMGVALAVPAWAYSLNIVQPLDNQTVLYPNESGLVVEVTTDALAPLDTLYLRLNGQAISANQVKTTLELDKIGLGTHTLSAEIVDERGRVLASDSQTFTVILNPVIQKQVREKKAEEERLAAYEALPWYKKLHLKLRQDDEEIGATKSSSDTTTGLTPTASNAGVLSMDSGVTGISAPAPMSNSSTGKATRRTSQIQNTLPTLTGFETLSLPETKPKKR